MCAWQDAHGMAELNEMQTQIQTQLGEIVAGNSLSMFSYLSQNDQSFIRHTFERTKRSGSYGRLGSVSLLLIMNIVLIIGWWGGSIGFSAACGIFVINVSSLWKIGDFQTFQIPLPLDYEIVEEADDDIDDGGSRERDEEQEDGAVSAQDYGLLFEQEQGVQDVEDEYRSPKVYLKTRTMEEPEPSPQLSSHRMQITPEMVAKVHRLVHILDQTPGISKETRDWVEQCANSLPSLEKTMS